MIRSTEEPKEVEIKRKSVTSEGLKVDLLIHWDINEIKVEDEITGETHIEYEYEEESYTVTVDDNQQGAEDYVKGNARIMRLKAQAKREAKTGKSVMTDSERADLRGDRANVAKGN